MAITSLENLRSDLYQSKAGNVLLILVGVILGQKFDLCKVRSGDLGFTDIPVSIVIGSLFQGRSSAAVGMILVAKSAPWQIPPDFSLRPDGDAAHDLVVGQAGVLSTSMIVGSQPDNGVIVLVFVNSLITNFMSIEKERLLMECDRIVLQIGGGQHQSAAGSYDPVFDQAGVVVQGFRQVDLFGFHRFSSLDV